MQNGFTKGLIVGGLIGASVSMMMERVVKTGRMMKVGRNFVRRSVTL